MEIENQITFSKYHSSLAVGVLDIVHSTETTLSLSAEKIDEFYLIFLQEISSILQQYDAKVIKNMGDGVLFYFPQSIDPVAISFEQVVGAGRALLKGKTNLNKKLSELNLPMISYRISMSYGPISAMLGSDEKIVDLFGATVNTCAKINKLAKPDTFIVGETLYSHLVPLNISTTPIGEYKLGETFSFRLYEVSADGNDLLGK